MSRLRPTFEEIEREARTSRLRILPERQRRTQQGILLDEVDFDDFDLSKYDRKAIMLNNDNDNNPEKGTQTDVFNETESESMKTPEEEMKDENEYESEESINITENQQEGERERTQRKSIMQRLYDGVFGEDALTEERDELKNMKQRIEQEEEENDENELSVEKQQTEESENSLPMNVKKSYDDSPETRVLRDPSSESSSSRRSSNRSVLLPVEEEALSEYVNSSAPETVESSNRTIEYVDEATPPQSVVSSRRSQETIEYIRSRRSSRASVQSVSS